MFSPPPLPLFRSLLHLFLPFFLTYFLRGSNFSHAPSFTAGSRGLFGEDRSTINRHWEDRRGRDGMRAADGDEEDEDEEDGHRASNCKGTHDCGAVGFGRGDGRV